MISQSKDVDRFDKRGETALYRAIGKRNFNRVRGLLEAGADVNLQCNQVAPIHVAVADVEILALLIDNDANIEAVNYNRCTPVQCAVSEGCADSVALLAFHGADLNRPHPFDESLIHSVVQRSGNVDTLETLAALDVVDVEKGPSDWTPLMQAVFNVDVEMVRCLLKLNANTRKSFRYGYNFQSDIDTIKTTLKEYESKTSDERMKIRDEALVQWKLKLSKRLMEFVHYKIVDICLAMSSLRLPSYVLLEIIDWLPNYYKVSRLKKVQLLENMQQSIRRIRGSVYLKSCCAVLTKKILKNDVTYNQARK